MLFNSFEYALFLPIVFVLYWFVTNKSLKAQNFLLLVVSYVFYGWWDWRFLSLIAFSSLVDYIAGLKIEHSDKRNTRRLFLTISLLTNLGFLGVFKYFNFFAQSLADGLAQVGYIMHPFTLDVVLPVGISFYTFQTMSYSIDVYRKKLQPTNDIIAFFAYVSFFPQLVAGPIERATNLLPQFQKKRVFSYEEGATGMRQILWGLFKKMVIADNCAVMVDQIFDNYETLPGSVLIMGSIYFALQIYGDFSGYSDIAIGTARLFGFKLMTNFRTPYFSRDVAEFWRRWHISLTTWFRDYLYIPLGGSRVNTARAIRNTFIIFLVSGFWHGANWTFIAWGAVNAIYFIPLLLTGYNRKNTGAIAENKHLPSLKEIFQMGLTFTLTCLAWVFFRAENISIAFEYLSNILTRPFLPENFYYFHPKYIFIIGVWGLLEWFVFRHDNALERINNTTPWLRRPAYFILGSITFLLMVNEAQTFIYFQF
ncbi:MULTISPECIES: MBOAT family O-acyltransferase [unclassified Carboxylicivirga]|uniref:MBOAT family O-acyltransferase n=1 Tax=Carboxylicivirga TaxID=1628153 RepID=UPI003D32C870